MHILDPNLKNLAATQDISNIDIRHDIIQYTYLYLKFDYCFHEAEACGVSHCLRMSQRPKKEKPTKRPRDPPMSDTIETNE